MCVLLALRDFVQFIIQQVQYLQCKNINLSVGCGSGFFEWFLSMHMQQEIHCVEVGCPRLDSAFNHVQDSIIMHIVQNTTVPDLDPGCRVADDADFTESVEHNEKCDKLVPWRPNCVL